MSVSIITFDKKLKQLLWNSPLCTGGGTCKQQIHPGLKPRADVTRSQNRVLLQLKYEVYERTGRWRASRRRGRRAGRGRRAPPGSRRSRDRRTPPPCPAPPAARPPPTRRSLPPASETTCRCTAGRSNNLSQKLTFTLSNGTAGNKIF